MTACELRKERFFSKWYHRCSVCKPAWSCNYEVEQDRGAINYAFDRVREAAMAERTEFVMPYTNPQSIVWNEDTAQFLDEWTQFDMYVPLSCRRFSHLLCRSEKLLRRADPRVGCHCFATWRAL